MVACWCVLAGTNACSTCSSGSIKTITYPFNYEYFNEMVENGDSRVSTSFVSVPMKKYKFKTTISSYK